MLRRAAADTDAVTHATAAYAAAALDAACFAAHTALSCPRFTSGATVFTRHARRALIRHRHLPAQRAMPPRCHDFIYATPCRYRR